MEDVIGRILGIKAGPGRLDVLKERLYITLKRELFIQQENQVLQ